MLFTQRLDIHTLLDFVFQKCLFIQPEQLKVN